MFQVANSTQKIETQFSRSLLATMQSVPGYLRTEQNKALAAKMLVLDDVKSPFYQLVQYPGTKATRRAIVAYNSLFQAISIFADSALPVGDAKSLHEMIRDAFNIVKEIWPNAWGKRPADSRLMHGVGLRSVAALVVFLLEQICAKSGTLGNSAWGEVKDVLERLKHKIVWTDEDAGTASPAVRKVWREQISNRQNTTQDIAALTSFLKKECMALAMEGAKKGRAHGKVES